MQYNIELCNSSFLTGFLPTEADWDQEICTGISPPAHGFVYVWYDK